MIWLQPRSITKRIPGTVTQATKNEPGSTQSYNVMARELELGIRYIDSIAESMIESLMVTTPDGTIQRVNRATLEMLGYS